MKNGLVIQEDGTKEWYKDDKLHREDGPAIEFPNGDKFWYINGKQHREDGPAIIHTYGRKEYWYNGKLHREDGPAVIEPDGTEEYWLNGIQYSKEEFLVKTTMEGFKQLKNEIPKIKTKKSKKIRNNF